jgi:hypothetical protein
LRCLRARGPSDKGLHPPQFAGQSAWLEEGGKGTPIPAGRRTGVSFFDKVSRRCDQGAGNLLRFKWELPVCLYTLVLQVICHPPDPDKVSGRRKSLGEAFGSPSLAVRHSRCWAVTAKEVSQKNCKHWPSLNCAGLFDF